MLPELLTQARSYLDTMAYDAVERSTFRAIIDEAERLHGGWQPIDQADRYAAPSLDLYDPGLAGEYGTSWDGYWDDGSQSWRAAVWCNSCTTWHDTKINPTLYRLRPAKPIVAAEEATA